MKDLVYQTMLREQVEWYRPGWLDRLWPGGSLAAGLGLLVRRRRGQKGQP